MIAEDEEQEPDKATKDRNYTVDEVVAGLLALTEVDLAKLDAISKGLGRVDKVGHCH